MACTCHVGSSIVQERSRVSGVGGALCCGWIYIPVPTGARPRQPAQAERRGVTDPPVKAAPRPDEDDASGGDALTFPGKIGRVRLSSSRLGRTCGYLSDDGMVIVVCFLSRLTGGEGADRARLLYLLETFVCSFHVLWSGAASADT